MMVWPRGGYEKRPDGTGRMVSLKAPAMRFRISEFGAGERKTAIPDSGREFTTLARGQPLSGEGRNPEGPV